MLMVSVVGGLYRGLAAAGIGPNKEPATRFRYHLPQRPCVVGRTGCANASVQLQGRWCRMRAGFEDWHRPFFLVDVDLVEVDVVSSLLMECYTRAAFLALELTRCVHERNPRSSSPRHVALVREARSKLDVVVQAEASSPFQP